jgi:c-di-GMP-binding flagellar brake protein YcgR
MVTSVLCQILPYQTNVQPFYLIIFAVAAVIFVLLRLYNKYRDKTAGTKLASEKKGNRKADKKDRPAKKNEQEYFGLNDEQASYFRKICSERHIHDPELFFANSKESDYLFELLTRGLDAISPPTAESEREKTLLFTIHEKVDLTRKSGKKITSTKLIEAGEILSLSVKSGEQYTATITRNTSNGLQCDIPHDSFGNELTLPTGTKMSAFFTSKHEHSYRFETKILQYESDTGFSRMVLAHSDQIELMPDRRHDRKEIHKECKFSPVTVADVVSGKKTEHKFFPSPKTFDGTLLDISAGGCSLQSVMQLKVGEYLQIQCILEEDIEETIVGKIVRLHRETPDSATVMHVQFAKMSRGTMNRIFAYIYYGERSK